MVVVLGIMVFSDFLIETLCSWIWNALWPNDSLLCIIVGIDLCKYNDLYKYLRDSSVILLTEDKKREIRTTYSLFLIDPM